MKLESIDRLGVMPNSGEWTSVGRCDGLEMVTQIFDLVSMTQILGIATPVIPYQAPPLIVAMSISKVPNVVFFRICFWLALWVTLVGLPFNFLWWQLIGFT